MDTKAWKQNWASVLKLEEPTKKTEPVLSSKTAVHLHQVTRRHDTKSRTINTDRSVNAAVPSNPSQWNKQTNSTVRCAACSDATPSDVPFYFPGLQDMKLPEMNLGTLYRFGGRNSFYSFKGKLKMEWKKKETETHRCAATVLRRTEQRWDRCDNQCNISICIHSSLHFWRKLKWFSENTQFWEQELSCSFIGFFVSPNSQHVATTEFYWFQ